MDRIAAIWTAFGGTPTKVGTIVHTGREVRLTYDSGAPCGVSVLHDAKRLAKAGMTVSFPVDASMPLPPYLAALIPPQHGPLWTFAIERMRLRGIVPAIEYAFWDVLMEVGRNGIGCLGVFPNDGTAEQWYGRQPVRPILGDVTDKHGLWDYLRDLAVETVTEEKIRAIDAEIGPSPGVTGMIPKLLAAVSPEWLSLNEVAPVDAMVKIEPEKYPSLMLLEQMCYLVHEQAGCSVPRTWMHHTCKGTPLLISERFDRSHGTPIPMESLYSILRQATNGRIIERWSHSGKILASGDPDSPYRPVPNEIIPRLEHIAEALKSPDVGLRPGQEKELFRRIALALMTGNSDLHLENLSVLGPRGEAMLSPIYDPAPMRAYPQHAMTLALGFNDLMLSRPGSHMVLWERLLRYAGESLKIRRDKALEILCGCHDVTTNYVEAIAEHAEGIAGDLRRERRWLPADIKANCGKERSAALDRLEAGLNAMATTASPEAPDRT